MTTPAGSRTIAVDPPAVDPAAVTFVPLAFLAQVVGGKAELAPGKGSAIIQATVYDPGMAQAEALLSALVSYPGANPATDVFGGPVGGVPDDSYLRDVFAEGPRPAAPCRSTPMGFVAGGMSSSSGPSGPISSGEMFLLRTGQFLPQLQVGYKTLSRTASTVRCDALVSTCRRGRRPNPCQAGQ